MGHSVFEVRGRVAALPLEIRPLTGTIIRLFRFAAALRKKQLLAGPNSDPQGREHPMPYSAPVLHRPQGREHPMPSSAPVLHRIV
jgi:hypothetical protein